VEAELEALLEGCRAADAELVAAQRTLLVREPFEVSQSAAVVNAVSAAVTAVAGAPPRLSGAGYWTDAAFIAAAGIPTVLFGPRGEGAHAVEEWVSIADLETVTRALVATARSLCA
jgi:acetylornithine deacetylase